jgi:hypothetical protein
VRTVARMSPPRDDVGAIALSISIGMAAGKCAQRPPSLSLCVSSINPARSVSESVVGRVWVLGGSFYQGACCSRRHRLGGVRG